MNFERMKGRCPNSKFLHKGTLNGFKFVYDGVSTNGGAVANIVNDDNEKVLGALFEINANHLTSLDKCEGYPKSYKRTRFNIQGEDGITYSAVAYFRTGKWIGQPTSKYRKIVIQGAKDCGLPNEYIQKYL